MLKTIEGGADWTDGQALVSKMKQTKISDHYARGGFIRADGMLMHDVFLFRVKKPAESKGPCGSFIWSGQSRPIRRMRRWLSHVVIGESD